MFFRSFLKLSFCSAILAFGQLIFAAAARAEDPPAGNPAAPFYKIGAVLPLSGAAAAIGESNRIGIEIAVSRINAEGGINAVPMAVLIEDSQSEPRAGLAAYRKLADIDGVPAVIATLGSVIFAIRPAAERDERVVFAESSHPGLTQNGSYVFRNFYTVDAAREALLEHAKKEGWKKIALLHAEEEWGEAAKADLAGSIEAAGAESGLEFSGAESFAKTAVDLRPQLLRLSAGAPDLLYIVGIGPPVAAAFRQMREISFRPAAAAFMVCGQGSIFSAASPYMDGAITIEADLPADAEPLSYLRSELAKRYPGRAPDQSMVVAFDAVLISASAFRAGSMGGSQIRDYIHRQGSFDGASGKVEFSKDGDCRRKMKVNAVFAGRCTPVEEGPETGPRADVRTLSD